MVKLDFGKIPKSPTRYHYYFTTPSPQALSASWSNSRNLRSVPLVSSPFILLRVLSYAKGPIQAAECHHASLKAPRILPHRSVNQPIMTGIKLIDFMVLIGHGQHELIIGDHHLAPFSGCAMGKWFHDNGKHGK